LGVGLHPWWLKELSSSQLEQCWQAIEQLASKASVIGETGIDRASRAGDIELQVSGWKRHEKLYPKNLLVFIMSVPVVIYYQLIPAGIQRELFCMTINGGIDETRQWLKRKRTLVLVQHFSRPSRCEGEGH
jgi:hypothetical protein